jgi:hypothetical protein
MCNRRNYIGTEFQFSIEKRHKGPRFYTLIANDDSHGGRGGLETLLDGGKVFLIGKVVAFSRCNAAIGR